ncbi:MAG: DNA translocase FtsK, partial [Clostridia bacterium]|nr:DNA translocase FtsK [Clostridia bacterium]
EVKMLMIDPKMVEFTVYNGIAHLEVPVVNNPRKAAGALSWAVSEMEKRYQLFAENRVRDIKGYNKLVETRPDLHRMHQIVIFIDELSDLMMVSPKEVEDSICRLAQLARAAGIHLVIATQRPSVDVITGIIKANIPSRIALSVSSQVDSRTILDVSGAEKLLGHGDMLFSPVGSTNMTRVQGCFISEEEVARVVDHIKSQSQAEYNEETMKEIETKAAAAESAKKKGVEEEDEESRWDPVLNDAVELVVTAGQASTSMLQTRLRLGYNRARRVIDQLEEKGVIGPQDGSKPRAVLMTRQQWYEMQALRGDVDAAPSLPDAFEADEEEDDDDFAPVSIDDVFADDGDYAGSDDF